MDKQALKAETRKTIGRKVKHLRKEGFLPGNIYGKKIESHSIQVILDDFKKTYSRVGETGLVEIDLGGDKRPVLIHNLQKDPITDAPLHVDFLQVDLKEKITASVPVEVVGESPAEKSGLGTVVTQLNEIEVEAFPQDLPENFVVDTSNLTEVDQAIFVKDLKYDKTKLEIKTEPEQIIVKVEPPQKEEVVEAPPVEETPEEGEEKEVSEGAEETQKTEAETPEEK